MVSSMSSTSKLITSKKSSSSSMGACFSVVLRRRSGSAAAAPTAMVVSVNGDLHQYKVPVPVSEVLQAESSSSSNSYILCNSDSLYFNDTVPPMASEEELLANQIYFLLPSSKANDRISALDMAALAVKASTALNKNSPKRSSRRKNNTQISPLLLSAQSGRKDFDHYQEVSSLEKIGSSSSSSNSSSAPPRGGKNGGSTNSAGAFTRSGSVRKLQRYTSKRAKMAVRSFRLRLSTIYEGTIVH